MKQNFSDSVYTRKIYELLWITYSITKNTMKDMQIRCLFPMNGRTPLILWPNILFSHIKSLVVGRVYPPPSTEVIRPSSTSRIEENIETQAKGS